MVPGRRSLGEGGNGEYLAPEVNIVQEEIQKSNIQEISKFQILLRFACLPTG
jgi:hypothetical protein